MVSIPNLMFCLFIEFFIINLSKKNPALNTGFLNQTIYFYKNYQILSDSISHNNVITIMIPSTV